MFSCLKSKPAQSRESASMNMHCPVQRNIRNQLSSVRHDETSPDKGEAYREDSAVVCIAL